MYIFVDVESVPSFQHGHPGAWYSSRIVGQPQRVSKERNLDLLGSPTFYNELQGMTHVYRGHHSILGRREDGLSIRRYRNNTHTRGNQGMPWLN